MLNLLPSSRGGAFWTSLAVAVLQVQCVQFEGRLGSGLLVALDGQVAHGGFGESD